MWQYNVMKSTFWRTIFIWRQFACAASWCFDSDATPAKCQVHESSEHPHPFVERLGSLKMHFPDNEKWRQEYYLKVSSQVALSEQQFPMLVGLNLLIDLILACKKSKLFTGLRSLLELYSCLLNLWTKGWFTVKKNSRKQKKKRKESDPMVCLREELICSVAYTGYPRV